MVFVDMDGVLAKWNTEASIEDTYEPGYFLARDEDPAIKELIRLLMGHGHKVAILSAVYPTGTAAADKHVWLDEHGLADVRRIFVPYGADKHLYIPELAEPMILIDDYSRNLHAWEAAGHIGVKYLNGINGTNGTWKGLTISRDMRAREMYALIAPLDLGREKNEYRNALLEEYGI